MMTHLWIGLRTPDEFGIFFARTYGNGEAADDVAYRRMGAPAAFESYCRPPLIASSPQAPRDHGIAAPSGQYRLIQFAIRLSVRFRTNRQVTPSIALLSRLRGYFGPDTVVKALALLAANKPPVEPVTGSLSLSDLTPP